LNTQLSGTGLALRSEFIQELREVLPQPVDFLEVTPEQWMHVGGAPGKKFAFYADHYPLIAHGTSLSIGSPAPLDLELIENIKHFLERFHVQHYSEHLSYSSDQHGHLYELLPLPLTEAAVSHVASRVLQVQALLEQPISLENIAYYCTPGQAMSELDFILRVIKEADCELLLDINNLFVNSTNHGYDPRHFIEQIPTQKISYVHIAGHQPLADDLLLDSHGEKVAEPVWDLLKFCYEVHGVLPTVLERDTQMPPLDQLLLETQQIKALQQRMRRAAYA
jgi:uncharacterized protein (UPF0276 family)